VTKKPDSGISGSAEGLRKHLAVLRDLMSIDNEFPLFKMIVKMDYEIMKMDGRKYTEIIRVLAERHCRSEQRIKDILTEANGYNYKRFLNKLEEIL